MDTKVIDSRIVEQGNAVRRRRECEKCWFRFTTFGESHGKALGVVLDGVPAGLKIDESFIQNELNRRKPGQNKFQTQRKESDKVEILSGVFNEISTGTPIAMNIFNDLNVDDLQSQLEKSLKDISSFLKIIG